MGSLCLLSAMFLGLLSALLASSQQLNGTYPFLEYKLIARPAHKRHRFAGLAVDYFHTGAGANDAVLNNDTTRFAAGYLIEDVQYFDYDGQNSPERYGFGFIPTDEGIEQGFWQKVTIDPFHSPTHGAAIVDGKLVYEPFGIYQWWYGWIVCDWYHLQPQLFHLTQKLGSFTYEGGPRLAIPKLCEVVDLVVEYLDDRHKRG